MTARTFLASTYVVADGKTTIFNFSFAGVNTDRDSGATPYLHPEDVKVQELFRDGSGYQHVVNRTGVLVGANAIRIDGAPVAEGREIRIYRETEIRFPLVDYRDGQSVSENDLDLANRQAVFLAQELSDATSSAISLDDSFNYNFMGRRAVNMAPGIDPMDAVNMSQLARTVRAGDNEGPIKPLPPVAERANKLMSFDSTGNPIAILPAPGTATQLQIDLADVTRGDRLLGVRKAVATAKARTQNDVNNDFITVLDIEGVKADPFHDSTEGFLKAPRGAYVPAGEYLVDAMRVDLTTFTGPGTVHTLQGSTISLDSDPLSTNYVQRKIMEPFYGFDGRGAGGTDTQIYPLAQYAPQGLAMDRDPATGKTRVFVSQSVGGPTWGPQELVRITEFAMREDGQVQAHTQFTPALRCSHAHLSALRENGKLYMYQSTRAPDDSINTTSETGKGWSKMEWKGTKNVSADIVNYNVWGRPGSGHRYEHYGKGCVQASQCGRYMILIGINYTGTAGGRSLFVYDRKEVETAANPLDCEPVFASHALRSLDNDSEQAYQGETSDGRYVYICWGSGAVFSRKGVSVYTLTGEKVRDIVMEGPAHMYSNDELRNGHPVLGTCIAFEPEGIVMRGKELHVTYVDYWRLGCPVVAYEGRNYVCIGSNTKGKTPNISALSWRITDRAPTHGDYNPNETYVLGAITRRSKVIYAATPRTGHALESPVVSRYLYPFSVAVGSSSAAELIDYSVPLGAPYRVSSHDVNKDEYRILFQHGYGYTLDIRDARDGSDNNIRGFVRTTAKVDGEHHVQVGAGDGTSTGGAMITAYASTSAVNPGAMRVNAAGTDLRLTLAGVTQMSLNADEIVAYKPIRPIADGVDDLGTISRRFNTVRALEYAVGTSTVTISSDTVNPEGEKLGSSGSFYINRSGGSWWRKASGSGNTGWVRVHPV